VGSAEDQAVEAVELEEEEGNFAQGDNEEQGVGDDSAPKAVDVERCTDPQGGRGKGEER